MQVGDSVILFDPQGSEWRATITATDHDTVALRLDEPLCTDREHPIDLWLFQGLAKGEKMDFIVQKATELGVALLVPMLTRRTVVRLDADRAAAKQARWQRIAQSAAEQCGATKVPPIRPPVPFRQAVTEAAKADVFLLFYEAAEEPLAKVLETLRLSPLSERVGRVALMVGPEGGFDPDEVSLAQRHGAHIVSLGKRILRTETASIVAVALVLYELGLLER
jgi:16S rRNA (uracil1498-N3)-methyltransferase